MGLVRKDVMTKDFNGVARILWTPHSYTISKLIMPRSK